MRPRCSLRTLEPLPHPALGVLPAVMAASGTEGPKSWDPWGLSLCWDTWPGDWTRGSLSPGIQPPSPHCSPHKSLSLMLAGTWNFYSFNGVFFLPPNTGFKRECVCVENKTSIDHSLELERSVPGQLLCTLKVSGRCFFLS